MVGLPRAARLPVLGASLSVLGVPLLLNYRAQRAAEDEIEDAKRTEAERSAIERIAETILYYALMEKATDTRIEVEERGLNLYYLIEGEWRIQMKIPLYVWKPLRQQLTRYVRQGEFHAGYSNYPSWMGTATRLTNFRAQLTTSERGETLRLQFERAPINEEEVVIRTDKLPDVVCLSCKDLNLPDAVWCWNCGDPLSHQKKPSDDYSLFSALLLAGFSIAASSGWWSRRARSPILGAGALVAATPFALEKLDERKQRKTDRENERRGISFSCEAPAVHLANQILVRAIVEKTSEIRLRESGNVIVRYKSGEAWLQAAVLPAHVWLALRTALLDRARGTVSCQGRKYWLSAELDSDVSGETLELRIGEIS